MSDSFRFGPLDMGGFHNYLEKRIQIIMESVKEAFIMACTEAVKRAKESGNYKDQTNNLRSSIGYVLYYKGVLVSDSFVKSGSGTGGGGEVSFKTKEGKEVSFTANAKLDFSGETGITKGIQLAQKVAARYRDGFIAVIVAGMDYALYVEANGYDVLTSSTLDITKDLQEYFDIINKQHGTKFQAHGRAE